MTSNTCIKSCMDLECILGGSCVDRGDRVDLGWILNGSWLDLDWILTGSWVDLDWILTGSWHWLDLEWILTGSWVDLDWVLTGSCVDLDWILTGSWHCLDLDWILSGSWLDLDRILSHLHSCVILLCRNFGLIWFLRLSEKTCDLKHTIGNHKKNEWNLKSKKPITSDKTNKY